MASETVADLRDEIAELLDIPKRLRPSSPHLGTQTLSKVAKTIGVENPHGTGPMLRKDVRQELAKRESDGDVVGHHVDAKPLRKAELVQLRDALQEGEDA